MIHNLLSVIIITRNEEHDIRACLQSVADLSDDIVIVDSGSTDQTLTIAREFTQNISHHDWNGYSAQKQFALEKAKGPWILNIDADERVTPALKTEIEQLISANSGMAAYDIPFHHYFMEKRLRFGGVQGETHIRLFRKDKSRYGTQKVHEGIEVQGLVGKCGGAIEHRSYKDLSEYFEKCNAYTSAIAKAKVAQGKRFHWWQHFRLPIEFISRYFFRLGILDGEPGLTYALLSSYYVWLKFLKRRDFETK